MRKKELTVKEMASLGGKARASKLTPERRMEISRKATQAKLDKKAKKSGL